MDSIFSPRHPFKKGNQWPYTIIIFIYLILVYKKNIKEFICWQINKEWIPYFSLVIQLSLCLHEFCKHQRHGKCHCVRILNLVQAQRDSSYWGVLYSSSQQVPKLISPISNGYFSLDCLIQSFLPRRSL